MLAVAVPSPSMLSSIIASSNPIDSMMLDFIVSIVGTAPETNLGYVYVTVMLWSFSPITMVEVSASGSAVPV